MFFLVKSTFQSAKSISGGTNGVANMGDILQMGDDRR
uniref:Uncharacterized protein n=1 Tax=Cucumis melo TaxID=3656 RepID=A0A9I9ECL7_CUCME